MLNFKRVRTLFRNFRMTQNSRLELCALHKRKRKNLAKMIKGADALRQRMVFGRRMSGLLLSQSVEPADSSPGV